MATIYLEFKGHRARYTPQATVSSTFLQTLPELVTPLKGHSLSRGESENYRRLLRSLLLYLCYLLFEL